MDKARLEYVVGALRALAIKTVSDCTFNKMTSYFGIDAERAVLLPSGDEKYRSFWVRDAAMMAESGLIDNCKLKEYVEIIAAHGQNGADERRLENGLTVPPYAVADHINYDGSPVFFPGTYSSGNDQGRGSFGYFPPFCDNYYFIIMVEAYLRQSLDTDILDKEYASMPLICRLEKAFSGYNLDEQGLLCESDGDKYTVDWGFVDTVKKSGRLLMASLLRYNAALAMARIFGSRMNNERCEYYTDIAQNIKNVIIDTFYDGETGWLYSASGIGRQHDVWATAYAVFLGITSDAKTLSALANAYKDGTAAIDGYVRHILTNEDFSSTSAWESSIAAYNTYQNGAYWATPTGWYSYALYKYNGEIDMLEDFLRHTELNKDHGTPFEWMNADKDKVSGLNYGTSGVLPYIGAKRIFDELQN